MICLVFTKTKLLAGISLKSPDLLSIKGNSAIEYGNKSMADSLKANLPEIKQAARSSGGQSVVRRGGRFGQGSFLISNRK